MRGNETTELTRKETKDLRVLVQFTSVYCKVHHQQQKLPMVTAAPGISVLKADKYRVCADCRDFLAYAIERRLRCPLNPRPTCKHCPVHCYRSDYRQKVREIMRFSGRYLLLRGRLDLLWHYFF